MEVCDTRTDIAFSRLLVCSYAVSGTGPVRSLKGLGGVDSKDSLLGANQIQGCFWGGGLGRDGTVGFERLARLAGPCARMGLRCIKPLAPSRNETNSSRVNGGAVGAILGICSYGGRDQAEFVATIKLVQPRPEGLASRQISRPRLTFREQLVGRFVQTLLLAASIRQMTN